MNSLYVLYLWFVLLILYTQRSYSPQGGDFEPQCCNHGKQPDYDPVKQYHLFLWKPQLSSSTVISFILDKNAFIHDFLDKNCSTHNPTLKRRL